MLLRKLITLEQLLAHPQVMTAMSQRLNYGDLQIFCSRYCQMFGNQPQLMAAVFFSLSDKELFEAGMTTMRSIYRNTKKILMKLNSFDSNETYKYVGTNEQCDGPLVPSTHKTVCNQTGQDDGSAHPQRSSLELAGDQCA